MLTAKTANIAKARRYLELRKVQNNGGLTHAGLEEIRALRRYFACKNWTEGSVKNFVRDWDRINVPVDTKPVMGKHAGWRVRLIQPPGIGKPEHFKGARDACCWRCHGKPLDTVTPDDMTPIQFYYNTVRHYAFGRCPRCGSIGGQLSNGGNKQ
jgi:hypothetical protein